MSFSLNGHKPILNEATQLSLSDVSADIIIAFNIH